MPDFPDITGPFSNELPDALDPFGLTDPIVIFDIVELKKEEMRLIALRRKKRDACKKNLQIAFAAALVVGWMSRGKGYDR